MLTVLKKQPEEKEVNLIGFGLGGQGRRRTQSSEERDSVASGRRISTNLKSNTAFPIMATQMLAIREETGAVGTMSGKVAEFYEGEVEESVNRLSTLMEPMAVLGIIVGTLVITMYMPIFKMGAVVTHGG